MKKYKRYLSFGVRSAVIAISFLLVYEMICVVVVPKYEFGDNWSTTTRALEFYDLEEDSVDVLFLGSSQALSAFNPQELYNEYGITSYNLGSPLQSLVISYYWLEEALATQHPSVVILEPYMLFTYDSSNGLNSDQASVRMAMDYMKPDTVKWAAVQTICSLDPRQTVLSYMLPTVRYHARWTELEPEDFLWGGMAEGIGLLGYELRTGTTEEAYDPLSSIDGSAVTEMEPVMREYLDRITALCLEQGIYLILAKTPTSGYESGRHNVLTEYALENQLAFYDFNTLGLYQSAGFDFGNDMADGYHANLSGSVKITSFLGGQLQTIYGLAPHTDEHWEYTAAIYEETIRGLQE